MWSAWVVTGRNSNPNAADWLRGPWASGNSRFAMPIDAQGTSWFYTPADVQSTTNLNYYGTTYSYTYDDLALTSYDTTPPSTLKENFVARMKKFGIENLQPEIISKMLLNKNAELVGGSDGSLSLKSGVNETVARLDRKSWTKVQKSLLEATNAKIPDEIYLQLEGVKGTNDTNFLSVYVNQQLIKSVSLFGLLGASMKENPHGANGLSFKFNITEVIDDLHLDSDINLGALNIQIKTKFPIPNNDVITVDRVAIYRLNK
jgi:tyrosinase